MKIITLGTGESCDFHSSKLNNLNPNIKKFAFHRTFMLLKERGIEVDYWTWTDPDAAESGLKWMYENPNSTHPKIILPYWSKSYLDMVKFYPIPGNLKGPRIKFHFQLLHSPPIIKNVIFINNSINNTKQNHLIKGHRFDNKQVVFHTPSNPNNKYTTSYGAENVFTRHLLPICHYLGATEVYNLGLDNQGLGFNRGIKQWHDYPHEIKESLKYFEQWRVWEEHHNMKIYRCMEDKFTNIGNIIPYKPLEELYV